MRVFRFMSKDEFNKYIAGTTLVNTTEHKAKTTSVGFCFFDIEDFVPEEAIHFLSGIVDTQVCAVFEVDKDKLNVSKGTYADDKPSNARTWQEMLKEIIEGKTPTFEATEYCTTNYSKEDFKLIRYTTNIELFTEGYFKKNPWKWQTI